MQIKSKTVYLILEKVLAAYLYFVGKTSRLTVRSSIPLDQMAKNGEKALYAFWHNRIFYYLYLFRRSKIAIPISTHRDGEFIARIAIELGFNVIRGSSTRGGIAVLNGMLDILNSGHAVAVTPDGPRGPIYSIQDGILFAAYKTQTPIRASVWFPKRCLRFKSWDNFIFPLPFNHFYVIVSEPISVSSREEIISKKEILKQELDKITNEAETYFKK